MKRIIINDFDVLEWLKTQPGGDTEAGIKRMIDPTDENWLYPQGLRVVLNKIPDDYHFVWANDNGTFIFESDYLISVKEQMELRRRMLDDAKYPTFDKDGRIAS